MQDIDNLQNALSAKHRAALLVSSMMLFAGFTVAMAHAEQATVFFGTGGGQSRGIYRATMNLVTGDLSQAELAAEISRPGFLALHPQATHLYAVCQIPTFKGAVAAFEIGADKESLRPLNHQDTGDAGPTHLSLSHDSRTLFVAHYSGGSVAAFPIDDSGKIMPRAASAKHTGSSVDPQRQDRAHPHWIGASRDDRFVLVPDLGTDQVVIYRFDRAKRTLDKHGAGKVPLGSGPRHLKFHPNRRWVYVVNELALTVTAFAFDEAAGSLTELQTVAALPQSERENLLTTASEIRIHPGGRFLYAGIRGHDTIAVFQIDQDSGALAFVEREPIRGSWPRNFAIDPTGRWLLAAGADTSTVSVFRIDQQGGDLVYTRKSIEVPSPICVVFLQR